MPNTTRIKSLLVAVACTLSFSAYAVAQVPRKIDVPAGQLTVALKTLAAQSGVEFVYSTDQLEGLKTNGVHGELTAQKALSKLLEGTNLKVTTHESGALLISLAGAPIKTSEVVRATDLRLVQSENAQSMASMQRVGNTEKSDPGSSSESAAAEADEASSKGIPEILVEGSRITNVDVKRTENDPQPYYILDSKMIQRSGAVDVEDFLKQRLTMNTTFVSRRQNPNDILGPTSSINLRGLGTNETLILVNGRRSAGVSYFGDNNQPDINGIPLSAIERIEVLPSSASAIYGGAAVGGVVNIVLKKDFQGGEVKYSYKNLSGADAPFQNIDGNYGFSVGPYDTRIMLTGHYSQGTSFVLQDRRNLVERGVSRILENAPQFLYTPRSPFPGATPNIVSAVYDSAGNPVNLILKDGTPLGSPITSIAAGASPGADISAGLLGNAGTYNLNLAQGVGYGALQNPFETVPTVRSFMATVRQEFTPVLEGFAELSTLGNTSRTVSNSLASSISVPATAPENPFRQRVRILAPVTDFSPYSGARSATDSATVGLLAKLPAQWSTEIDYTWSRNSYEGHFHAPDGTAFSAAIANGTLNPFVDTVLYPMDLAPYVATTRYSGKTTLNDLALRASGPVRLLPWNRANLAIGLERRYEGTRDADRYLDYPITTANNLQQVYFGQSQATDSAYVEAQIPLLAAGKSIPGLNALDLQLAMRTERYTVYAGTRYATITPVSFQASDPPQGQEATIRYTATSPTIALKYQPFADFALRASFAKGFLPPTQAQLLPDPTLQCGAPCAQIVDFQTGQSYQVDFTGGGNPNLKPQTSRNWNLGLIYQPQEDFLKNLRVDVEYYRIIQPDYITNPAAEQVASDPSLAQLPGRVTRDPVTGLITVVDTSYLNATEYRTSGWDLKIDYSHPTAMGNLYLNLLGTVIEHDRRQYAIGSPMLDYAGFPASGGEGKLKSNATVSWENRGWTLGWTTTYFGGYSQVSAPGSPNALLYGPDSTYTDAQGANTIPSQMYHQLFGSYRFDSGAPGASSGLRSLASGLEVQLDIANVFNTLPPFDVYHAPYYYSPYGDARLRTYQISLRKSF